MPIVQNEEGSTEKERKRQDGIRPKPTAVWSQPIVPKSEDDVFAMLVKNDTYEL